MRPHSPGKTEIAVTTKLGKDQRMGIQEASCVTGKGRRDNNASGSCLIPYYKGKSHGATGFSLFIY